jgi:hypothetical protein
MLLILIAIAWCSIAVFALALCLAAAVGDRDEELAGTDARTAVRGAGSYAAGLEPDLLLDPLDVARGARGRLPSAVLAPPAGV